MVEIKWTDLAIDNLTDIGNYIEKDSIRYAEIIVNKIFDATNILERFPNSGRVVPELEDINTRELICGNYRIVYRLLNEKRIDILTIHHSARILTNIL